MLIFTLDINECDNDDLNRCHEDAECTDKIGSYECKCKTGFTGDGMICTESMFQLLQICN